MKRFRFTLLAICLVLIYLGWADLDLYLRNQTPLPIPLAELERQGAPREWLTIQGAYPDFSQAISTSGSLEVDAVLLPLKRSPEADAFRIVAETRDPAFLELFRTYHFVLETEEEKSAFLAEHQAQLAGPRDLTGVVVTGSIASGNRDKLLELAKEIGLPVSEDVIFVSEGKEIAAIRGFFFLGLALLALVKIFSQWKQPAPPAAD
jgi:hypothetical protein